MTEEAKSQYPTADPQHALDSANDGKNWMRWLAVGGLVYVILVAVAAIGTGFKWAAGGADAAAALFEFATNPILGLLVGILATSLVQSSSTVSSVIVGLVAGGVPVSAAVPMIMGANIGTTVTNTLVSLGHARDPKEFKRAFEVATVHDFFNLLAVLVFLPLEMTTGILERSAAAITSWLAGGDSMSIGAFNFVKPLTGPVVDGLKSVLSGLPEPFGGVVMVALAIAAIFFSITTLGRLLKALMVGRAKAVLHAAVGRGPVASITSGTVVTVLVQSSSTTTSLMVPLAGGGIFDLRKIYPFTLGANIGTTITALLAATGVTGPLSNFALQIALVHLLFNTFAVVLIYGLPVLREIPPRMAEWLASLASKRRWYAIVYVLLVFFAIPTALILVT